MIDEKLIKIEGLKALRDKLIKESINIISNLNKVYNPLENNSDYIKLNKLKKEYEYIENQLEILDPKRNEVLF